MNRLPYITITVTLTFSIFTAATIMSLMTASHDPPEPDADCRVQAWKEVHHCIDEGSDRKGECLVGGAELLRACEGR